MRTHMRYTPSAGQCAVIHVLCDANPKRKHCSKNSPILSCTKPMFRIYISKPHRELLRIFRRDVLVYKTKIGALWGKQYKFSILAMHGFQREKCKQAFFHFDKVILPSDINRTRSDQTSVRYHQSKSPLFNPSSALTCDLRWK